MRVLGGLRVRGEHCRGPRKQRPTPPLSRSEVVHPFLRERSVRAQAQGRWPATGRREDRRSPQRPSSCGWRQL